MPRTNRKKSPTKIYHVIARGINRQNIFEDGQDCEAFLQILSDLCKKQECTVYAWCLMNNHYHMLIKERKKNLGQLMKSIGVRYAHFFNKKYERVGHVFQDRFKSVPIANNKQLLAVCRYIHMNPVKAKICRKPERYEYSSYREYLYIAKDSAVKRAPILVTDTTLILSMMDIESFKKFTTEYSDLLLLDYAPDKFQRMPDTTAKEIMNKVCGCKNTSEFQCLDAGARKRAIKKMIDAGVMIRQAARLTGYSTTLIYKALKE